MDKIIYVILILTVVHMSTQFFYKTEFIQADGVTEAPITSLQWNLTDSCGFKMQNHNLSIEDIYKNNDPCYQQLNKRWHIDDIGLENLSNKTKCCATKDLYLCFVKYTPKFCSQEEVQAIKEILPTVFNGLTVNMCSQPAFGTNYCAEI